MHSEPAQRSPSGVPPGIDDERCLIARVLDGDRSALVSLMQRYNQRLYRLAVAIVSDECEAEDVLQESYLRALEHLVEHSGERSLGAWLASIVRHEAIDRLRLYKRRRAHVILETDSRRRPIPEDLPINAAQADEIVSNPEVMMQRDQMQHALEAGIESLPLQFRTVFMLRQIEGLSVAETAEYLAIPEATVRSRDCRARRILRSKLGDQIHAAAPQAFTFLNQRCASLTARVMGRLGRKTCS